MPTSAHKEVTVLGEWLMVGLIYLAVATLVVLAWLAVFAIFGTAITALVNRIAIKLKIGNQDGDVTAAVSDDDVNETEQLRSMLQTQSPDPAV